MSDLAAVSEHIRFGIERLREANGHHEFEHLCRHFARLRISPWVIPATGPVADGGDQGRDFETFLSFLSRELVSDGTHWLAANCDGKRLAFGCTLQREDLATKIKRDISKIAENEPRVDVVYYFLGDGLPVAARHKLQSWAAEEFSIVLEIIDALALSEQLSDRDLFWIAERYLKIPKEIYPTDAELPSEYEEKKLQWAAVSCDTVNVSDFSDIRDLARYALHENSIDIGFWLGLLDSINRESPSESIRRSALYEFLAISMRNDRSFIGLEVRVAEFLEGLSSISQPDQADDALVILAYAVTSYHMKVGAFEKEVIEAWCKAAWNVVVSKLAENTSNADRCYWLMLRGSIEIQLGSVVHGYLDINQAIEFWIEFVDTVGECPTFPLSTFNKCVSALVSVIGDSERFDVLCSKLDGHIATRAGNAQAADNCRDRAVAFYESGRVLKAIDQIHKAKIGWFSGDTMEGSAIACHVLSRFYREMGLNFAAKYYAMVEAFISAKFSDDSLRGRIPDALYAAVVCMHAQGHWFSYWKLGEMFVQARHIYGRNTTEYEKGDTFWAHLIAEYQSIALTERLFPSVVPLVRELHSNLKLDAAFDQLLNNARESWSTSTDAEVAQRLSQQLDGPPWSDIGVNVTAEFRALGITWKFEWANDRMITAAAEEFLSLLQISLVELAKFDTCLLGGEVRVSIISQDVAALELEELPSNRDSQWKLILPQPEDSGGKGGVIDFGPLVGAIAEIIRSLSLLPKKDFESLIIDKWLGEIMRNGFFAQTYRHVYLWLVSEETFCADLKVSSGFFLDGWVTQAREDARQLVGKCSIVNSISDEELRQGIENRYQRCLPPVRITLERLAANSEFQETKQKLFEEGWKDWHLLLAIFNIAMSYRNENAIRAARSSKEASEVIRKRGEREEREDDPPIPFERFSYDNFKMTLRVTMLSTLQGHGLIVHQRTPNFEAIEEFVGLHLNYWGLDDVHQAIF